MKLAVGCEVRGEVMDMAFGGEGVLKVDGAVIFVPFAAVGDRLRVSICEEGKSFYRAQILEILNASPNREEPPCPYFSRCGGCQYQHITYPAEREHKEKQLRDIFQRIAKVPDPVIRPILFSNPYGYRNRITVHNEYGSIGFRSTSGRDLVDIEECLLATPEVNRKLSILRSKWRPRPHYSIRADEVAGEVFYQTNAPMSSTLRQTVCQSIEGSIQAVVEGYAGTGFFTHEFPLHVKEIVSIEESSKAVALSKAEADQRVVAYIEGSVEEHLSGAYHLLQAQPIACLLDPPREGLSEVVRQDLLKLPFEQLIYLSCNPATLARDILAISSRWEPLYFQPLDLFPRTAHLECLAVLTPRAV